MNEKFNKNTNVEKFTNMLGKAVCLIVKEPLHQTGQTEGTENLKEIDKKKTADP